MEWYRSNGTNKLQIKDRKILSGQSNGSRGLQNKEQGNGSGGLQILGQRSPRRRQQGIGPEGLQMIHSSQQPVGHGGLQFTQSSRLILDYKWAIAQEQWLQKYYSF